MGLNIKVNKMNDCHPNGVNLIRRNGTSYPTDSSTKQDDNQRKASNNSSDSNNNAQELRLQQEQEEEAKFTKELNTFGVNPSESPLFISLFVNLKDGNFCTFYMYVPAHN